MRGRFWLVCGVAFVALAVGLGAGWWLRGADTHSPQALHADEPAVRPPTRELPLGAEASHPEAREQRIGAESGDGKGLRGEAPATSAPRRASLDPDIVSDFAGRVDSHLSFRRGGAEDLTGSAVDDEQRARDRAEDFAEFSDGPVARDPDVEAKRSASNDERDCLPLGAQGCGRDVDCCGAAVCRTRAGEIAGFRECREEG